MKHLVALLCTLLMLTTLLTACGGCDHAYTNAGDIQCNDCGYNRLAGTWTVTIQGKPGEMTLKKDGTGTITSSDHSRPCTWEIKNNALTVTQEIDGFTKVFLNEVTYALEEDTLIVTSHKGNQLVFKKK
ncbi:MAG: hypothetical protein E7527_06750 [Ruminococcaceae bacterium]|nr:hypothetical protein [Oscillospiraceae bacterium]